jgi:hypothetical protein
MRKMKRERTRIEGEKGGRSVWACGQAKGYNAYFSTQTP